MMISPTGADMTLTTKQGIKLLKISTLKNLCREVIDQHDSGLITDYELVCKLYELVVPALPPAPEKGDLDPNTGLRY
jgi:hypothetical protein